MSPERKNCRVDASSSAPRRRPRRSRRMRPAQAPRWHARRTQTCSDAHARARGARGGFDQPLRHLSAQSIRIEYARGQDEGRNTSADQSVPEQCPPLLQPPLECIEGVADPFRGLVAGAAVEETEDEREAVLLGQPVELLVEHPAEVPPRHVRERVGLLGRPRPGAGRAGGGRGCAARVIRTAARCSHAGSAAGPAHRPPRRCQPEEGGLEGVLRVRRVAEPPPADAASTTGPCRRTRSAKAP